MRKAGLPSTGATAEMASLVVCSTGADTSVRPYKVRRSWQAALRGGGGAM